MTWTVVALALAAAALWWGRDHPALGPLRQLLPAVGPASPGLPRLGRGADDAARKCVGPDATVTYTDGTCPAGSRAQPLDGGSLSVLPAPAATAVPRAEGAASAQTPLRRLAGEGSVPQLHEQRVERALQR
jgi:hypothetical protein